MTTIIPSFLAGVLVGVGLMLKFIEWLDRNI